MNPIVSLIVSYGRSRHISDSDSDYSQSSYMISVLKCVLLLFIPSVIDACHFSGKDVVLVTLSDGGPW